MMIILKEVMIIASLKNSPNLVSLFIIVIVFILVNFGRRGFISNENKYEFRLLDRVTPSPSKYMLLGKTNIFDLGPRYSN